MIVIKGGDVLTTNGWQKTDVTIDGERIYEIGPDLAGEDLIDATGCLVGPGFVDIHTHLREPGQTWKEDVESASRAAVAGGFTAVVAMPNTDPAIDEVKIVEEVVERGGEAGLIDVVVAAALTKGRLGLEITNLESLYEAGVRIFSDDGDAVEEESLMTEIMRRLAELPGAVLAQHAEIRSMTFGGHMHAGSIAVSLGMGGLPTAAESQLVARDLDLVALTGVAYHCQHVSAEATVDLVAQARRSGLNVTAEVTPHHLTLTDQDAGGLDPNLKMYPPLRTPDDRDALVAALREGVITLVATDHAPHTSSEKAVAYEEAPRGVVGLETSAAVTWGVLSDRDRFFDVMSIAPREVSSTGGGLLEVGNRADVTVFDPHGTWVVESFESKSSNSPFLGHELKGRVMATVHKGVLTHG